jgi:hypothetical protein
MTRARIRALVASTAAAAVLVHGLVGHGLPHASDDGMAGAAAGLCLLLVPALAFARMRTPGVHHTPVLGEAASIAVSAPRRSPLDGRARASPSALQRFRN